ncbi:MAG: tRNA preQ1(34) S-adenosylmethionine ribosyltransferase-isomerase QueA [Gammaproteobacteria bacterium RIFCSPHIGHO2_12_FULL_41_20]|nr:MAG: tRNA preQ1(34) S-adenosylmethionine ribosyltransferase-isomerase QueA [Gammaproteobacteria bacterium RIFCSPHIGHO2_12_FULL_41_20]
MKLSDFLYDLPAELIAQHPLADRSASRLLCLDRHTGIIQHCQFSAIIDLLTAKDLLVFNNTRVIPARLLGSKDTGGQIEVFVERILDARRISAKVRASKPPRPGSRLWLGEQEACLFEVMHREDEFYILYSHDSQPVLTVIESIGQIPLPPYIDRLPENHDSERYQTIYAQHKGSVAAPTAGLHFDEELFSRLRAKGVAIGFLTLHVGAGTYTPVRTENIQAHRMHAEYLEVSSALCEQVRMTQQRGGRVVAVGTTTVRGLETASASGKIQPYSGETAIFIYPGYLFRCVDALITNLHLPGSSLLMLVCALGGHAAMMRAYHAAVAQRYRFFSYGDAMWVGVDA